MDKVTRGFKVVRKVGNMLVSVFATGDRLQTTYEPGSSVSNSHGPLMFFPELRDARSFRFRFGIVLWETTEIWSCTVTDARVCPSVLTGMFSSAVASRFWKGTHAYATMNAPPGTWVADTITLVGRTD